MSLVMVVVSARATTASSATASSATTASLGNGYDNELGNSSNSELGNDNGLNPLSPMMPRTRHQASMERLLRSSSRMHTR